MVISSRSSKSLFAKLLVFVWLFSTVPLLISPAYSQQNGSNEVDVFFLFDDTISFETYAPSVKAIFNSLVTDLEAAQPQANFGFGVGRFEDYGGPGFTFAGTGNPEQRPFILNQPIVTAATAGGTTARNNLILDAFDRTAPGIGGDDPEASLAEGLYQVATGAGFDGDGDGSFNGSDETQVAGSVSAQTAADGSGDVPSFSSLAANVLHSGNIGGAGFRPNALKLVILATDLCPVTAFPNGLPIPQSISGTYSTEAVEDFACHSTTPGDDRFGFVSDALSAGSNMVQSAVVPRGAGTVQATINALNAAGIRVLSMGPGVLPVTPRTGPGHDPSAYMSALGRLTGGIDSNGLPLVFDIRGGGETLKNKILSSIVIASAPDPGCVKQDISAVLKSLQRSVQNEQKLLRKVRSAVRKRGRGSISSSAGRKSNALQAKLDAALAGIPAEINTCAPTICSDVDLTPQINQCNSVIGSLEKLIRSTLKKAALRDDKAVKAGKIALATAKKSSAKIPLVTSKCS